MTLESCSSLHQAMNFICPSLEPGLALQLTLTTTSDITPLLSLSLKRSCQRLSTLSRNPQLLPWEQAGLASWGTAWRATRTKKSWLDGGHLRWSGLQLTQHLAARLERAWPRWTRPDSDQGNRIFNPQRRNQINGGYFKPLLLGVGCGINAWWRMSFSSLANINCLPPSCPLNITNFLWNQKVTSCFHWVTSDAQCFLLWQYFWGPPYKPFPCARRKWELIYISII